MTSEQHSNPTDSSGLRHRIPADAVVARYAPSAARSYAVRCAILAALSAVVLVAVIVLAVTNGIHWAITVILCLIIGGLGLFALLGVSTAKETWGNDDRLAIAVSSEGITLPLAGLIRWNEMAGIKVVDTRVFTISKALQDWAFGSTDQSVTVYASDVDSVLARADEKAKFGLTVNDAGVKTGFPGGFGRHMQQPSFAEIVTAVTSHAAQHGIPVSHNKPV